MPGGKHRPSVQGRSLRKPSARNQPDEWLTVDEVCEIVKISRRTFERYLSHGTGPRVKRFGESRNSPIRVRRDWLDEWMENGAA